MGKKNPEPLDKFYQVAVKVNNNEEKDDILTKWSKLKANKYVPAIENVFIEKYPAYFYLIRTDASGLTAVDYNDNYATSRGKKVLGYKEFLNIYFYKPSKYVKQLQFESRKDMKNIIEKIGNFLDEMDTGHDDYFEIQKLEKELDRYKKNLKLSDTVTIRDRIKKIEDRLKYLKRR